jgi:hypothetical protein
MPSPFEALPLPLTPAEPDAAFAQDLCARVERALDPPAPPPRDRPYAGPPDAVPGIRSASGSLDGEMERARPQDC